MPTLSITEEQIADLIKQLPPERRTSMLIALATEETASERDSRLEAGATRLRRLAAERGLTWGTMDDDERLSFVDDLIHEDRGCPGS